jgi:hypothetical protein
MLGGPTRCELSALIARRPLEDRPVLFRRMLSRQAPGTRRRGGGMCRLERRARRGLWNHEMKKGTRHRSDGVDVSPVK